MEFKTRSWMTRQLPSPLESPPCRRRAEATPLHGSIAAREPIHAEAEPVKQRASDICSGIDQEKIDHFSIVRAICIGRRKARSAAGQQSTLCVSIGRFLQILNLYCNSGAGEVEARIGEKSSKDLGYLAAKGQWES